jgi:DNA-binding response OmpR family regulator
VLLVEDEPRVADFINRGLRAENHGVTVASSGSEGVDLAKTGEFDVIVLDLMLPDMHGYDVCQRLRLEGDHTPILMLTAMDAVEDKIKGLKAGADDYLTKPFAPKELSARIRALLRRIRPVQPGHERLVFGDLEVIPEEGKVVKAGEEVHLTKTEFRLLCELALNRGKVFSREELLDRVWEYDYFGDGRLVDVHIRRLRTKVEVDPANPRHVVTVRGLGYRLQA